MNKETLARCQRFGDVRVELHRAPFLGLIAVGSKQFTSANWMP
jgi:hypothetical protein